MSIFEWISFFSILLFALLGGFFPIFFREKAKSEEGFPGGEAFTSGVFLALSLIIMLPTGAHLFKKMYPDIDYPLAFCIAVVSFLLLLCLEHAAEHSSNKSEKENSCNIFFSIIMTVMIAIPSFLLGTAIGISGETLSGFFILAAVLAHKGTAGFGLSLMISRSGLSRVQAIVLYGIFAISTPIGIISGSDMKTLLSGDVMLIVKATILAVTSGVFLFMATLHGLQNAPLVKHCASKRGFILMLIGFVLTALVRFALGFAHGG